MWGFSFKGNMRNYSNSFASVLKSGKPVTETTGREVPSLVLDDTCFSDRDFNLSLMGKVKDINALPNFYGSRNGEKYESDKEVDKVSESSYMQGDALFYDNDNNKSKESNVQFEDLFNIYDLLNKNKESDGNSKEGELKYPPGFTPKENSVNEVHKKEMEAPLEEVKKNSYNSFRDNFLNVSYCSQRFKAGNSGGILCVWEPTLFLKENITSSDYFLAVTGTWIPTWDGECVIMGDFNEARSEHERYGSVFNVQSAAAFNNFISLAGLIDLPLDGYAYTWKKLQALKIIIRVWTKNAKKCSYKKKSSIQSKLFDIDKIISQGRSNEVILNDRSILLKELYDIISLDLEEMAQKEKVRWAIKDIGNSLRTIFQLLSWSSSLQILANRLSSVIPDLISDVQSSFISNRKILDGPFILNELLSWCKYKKLKAMVFKVDFKKDFDSIRTIKAIHGKKGNLGAHGNITRRSPWLDIVREINVIRSKVESASHLFFTCHVARLIWKKVFRWWDLDENMIDSYDDWLFLLKNIRLPKRLKDLFEGRTRGRVTGEDPESFKDDDIPRLFGAPRKSKAQCSTSSSVASSLQKEQFAELMQQQILLDREAKKEKIEREIMAILEICEIQKRNKEFKILTFDTTGMSPADAAKTEEKNMSNDREEEALLRVRLPPPRSIPPRNREALEVELYLNQKKLYPPYLFSEDEKEPHIKIILNFKFSYE
nr:RNA-directed DNA polymerase, eukaryota [Tanacetum cinerariifolium]